MSLENEPKNKPFEFPPIYKILVYITNDEEESYRVGGPNGVTEITRFELPGPHCMLPYVRVWKGSEAFTDFALHQIVGIYYNLEPKK
mgnify:FL=1